LTFNINITKVIDNIGHQNAVINNRLTFYVQLSMENELYLTKSEICVINELMLNESNIDIKLTPN